VFLWNRVGFQLTHVFDQPCNQHLRGLKALQFRHEAVPFDFTSNGKSMIGGMLLQFTEG
jgi:hypothetical protein